MSFISHSHMTVQAVKDYMAVSSFIIDNLIHPSGLFIKMTDMVKNVVVALVFSSEN